VRLLVDDEADDERQDEDDEADAEVLDHRLPQRWRRRRTLCYVLWGINDVSFVKLLTLSKSMTSHIEPHEFSEWICTDEELTFWRRAVDGLRERGALLPSTCLHPPDVPFPHPQAPQTAARAL
jgi:hypothetical protein